MEIRRIKMNDLLRNKDILTELFYENLSTSCNNIEGLLKIAEHKYNDVIKFCEDNTAILIGAFDEDYLQGVLWAYVRVVLSESRIHISQLIVKKELRKKGIGKMLLDELDYEAAKKGIHTVELLTSIDNNKAISFYKNRGYVIAQVQMVKRI